MNCCIKRDADEIDVQEENLTTCSRSSVLSLKRIPRPPNAFMLYANENRKTMAQLYPADSNKEISKRLGEGWKTLDPPDKDRYFKRAKVIDLEHKKKYPDYSYNPKEARIRKAMREAMRDRSIGASPMLPRPSARRVGHGWIGSLSHDELIMSAAGSLPSPSLRPSRMDSPAGGCFPISTGNGNGQFMPSMGGGYGKMEGPMSPTPPAGSSLHSDYMQPNPLAQLQQQADMWHTYPDMRPRPSSNPYMMSDQMASDYHHQPSASEVASSMVMDKRLRQTSSASVSAISNAASSTSCMDMTPPHSNENVPPDDSQNLKNEADMVHIFEKPMVDPLNVQPLMENNNMQQQQNEPQYLHVYDGPNIMQHQYEKPVEDCKMRKNPCMHETYKKNLNNTMVLPLSCTKFSASPELFTNNTEYHREYISKYFQNLPDYQVLNVTSEDGISFPYVTIATNIKYKTSNDNMRNSYMKNDHFA